MDSYFLEEEKYVERMGIRVCEEDVNERLWVAKVCDRVSVSI